VLWIRIGLKADPDPAFYLSAGVDLDPDPGSRTHADPNFHVDVDPDPDPDWYQNNADPRADYPKFSACLKILNFFT
jgi:hypothetical protein